MSSPFRLVVFDLDGTLVDSRRDLAESANQILREYGCCEQVEEALGRMVGDGAPTLVARAFRAAGREAPPEALERFLAVYNGRLLKHTRPYAGIDVVLARLSMRATLAVLTNKPLRPARTILEHFDLVKHFALPIVGGDGPVPKKPDPAGLRHLMGAAQLTADQSVLVGDSVVDYQTARAAGVRLCIARYGFGSDSLDANRLGPGDLAVETPAALLDLL